MGNENFRASAFTPDEDDTTRLRQQPLHPSVPTHKELDVLSPSINPLYPKSPPQPHLQYVDRFLSLRCAPDLLKLNIFPDAKELTESFAVLEALTRFFPHLSSSPTHPTFFVVGDGSTPRTGALLSFIYPNSKVYSVDPQMTLPSSSVSNLATHPSVPNLIMYRGPVEDVAAAAPSIILVLVHAHVSLAACLNSVGSACKVEGIITMPCCNWFEGQSSFQNRGPDREGQDWGCWSEKRLVRVWESDDGDRSGFYSRVDEGREGMEVSAR